MVTVDEAKAHLRVEHVEEDPLIQTYLDAAVQAAADYTGADFTSSMPTPVVAAVLLLVGDLYEHREGAIVGARINVNPTVARLLDPYRKMNVE